MKPWRICTVRQVEDFKRLMRLVPAWSSGLLLGIPIGIQNSLTILQALKMDRLLGKHFEIPSGSIIVIVNISTLFFITIFDQIFNPIWKMITQKLPTLFQRIGVGRVFNTLAVVIAATVESKRLKIAHDQNSTVPMSVLWLFPQLILLGIGEAFHFPAQVALYYQDFPGSLKNTATILVSLLLVISLYIYLSTALIDFCSRVTNWLPDDINKSKLDNVYWVTVVIGTVNFGLFVLVCVKFYKNQNVEKVDKQSDSISYE